MRKNCGGNAKIAEIAGNCGNCVRIAIINYPPVHTKYKVYNDEQCANQFLSPFSENIVICAIYDYPLGNGMGTQGPICMQLRHNPAKPWCVGLEKAAKVQKMMNGADVYP